MKALCGWLDHGGKCLELEMDARQHAMFIENLFESDSAPVDIGSLQTTGGWVLRHDGICTAIIGHPRWHDGALSRIASESGDAAALLEAYRQHGHACLQQLAGAFALAILDASKGELLVAIDRMGQFPLYYGTANGALVFGTRVGAVRCHPDIDSELSADGLYQYLYFHMLPSPVSIFRGVRKLQAGQALIATAQGHHVQQYWVPRFREQDGFHVAQAEEELRYGLQQAVADVADDDTTGAFLSGGLDSSCVAGMLARKLPNPATFSIGFDAEGYDEIAYARIASAHFGSKAHEYYVTPEDVLTAVPLIAQSYDEPFGNSSALPAFFCAQLAKQNGITRLLAGDGGDELFAGNERYAKQGLFEPWQKLPGAIRNVLETGMARLPKRPMPLRKLKNYVEQARVPLPDRLQTYNFLHRLDANEVFEADFLAQIDPRAPLEAMGSIYHRPDNASSLNRMLYLDWQHTLADNDLRKVRQMCDLAGVDVAFPMLDERLLELSLRIPTNLKLRRGRLRHFYKEAFSGFLPPEIIEKKKHGFGLPFGVWMQTHGPLREMAYDSLSRLKGQNIIQPAFLDKLISLHRDGHAAYFGEMIWVLMMLDLWLHSRGQGGMATDNAAQAVLAT